MALALASCAEQPGVGTYRVDVEEMRVQLRRVFARMPQATQLLLGGQLETMIESLSNTEFTLRANQTFEGHTEAEGKLAMVRGTWSLHQEEGSEQRVISLLQTHENGEASELSLSGAFNGHSIHLIEGQGRDQIEVVLRRVNATP